MTFPYSPTPGPRPGPPSGGYRPAPPPGGLRPTPAQERPSEDEDLGDAPVRKEPREDVDGYATRDEADGTVDGDDPREVPREDVGEPTAPRAASEGGPSTGHPAVDAVLRSLANAAQLAPADQIAEYEAAHEVLRETLAGIDG